jgi:hypothetical protein
MQDTRLNRLVDLTVGQLNRWLRNPWRRLSVQIISLLLGFFLGTSISTIAGQRAELDVYVAAILVALAELTSRITYSRRLNIGRSLPIDLLNTLKIGLTYSLFVEAFKLGS